MLRLQRRATGGYTVVEVVIALFLLAMVLGGVYRTIGAAARLRATAHGRYLAVIIANNRIERAKNVPFAELPLLQETNVRVDDRGVVDPEGRHHRTTIVRMNHGDNPRLAFMTVSVEPPATRPGATRTAESVTTLLTEYLEP